MKISEIDAQIAKLTEQKEEALKAQRVADLETVRELCKLHGFSKTDLRGAIKERKKPKAVVAVAPKAKKKAK